MGKQLKFSRQLRNENLGLVDAAYTNQKELAAKVNSALNDKVAHTVTLEQR